MEETPLTRLQVFCFERGLVTSISVSYGAGNDQLAFVNILEGFQVPGGILAVKEDEKSREGLEEQNGWGE